MSGTVYFASQLALPTILALFVLHGLFGLVRLLIAKQSALSISGTLYWWWITDEEGSKISERVMKTGNETKLQGKQ